MDGTDDVWFECPIGVFKDQGVKPILALHDVAHPLVRGHDANSANPPIESLALAHEAV